MNPHLPTRHAPAHTHRPLATPPDHRQGGAGAQGHQRVRGGEAPRADGARAQRRARRVRRRDRRADGISAAAAAIAQRRTVCRRGRRSDGVSAQLAVSLQVRGASAACAFAGAALCAALAAGGSSGSQLPVAALCLFVPGTARLMAYARGSSKPPPAPASPFVNAIRKH